MRNTINQSKTIKMIRFFDREIIEKNGSPLVVVWEYDNSLNYSERLAKELETPERFFSEYVIPKVLERRGQFCEEIGCLQSVEVTFNFRQVLYLAFTDPLRDYWGSVSFPYFFNNKLCEWAHTSIQLYKDEPPRKPFRFHCRIFSNYNHIYYMEVPAETALSRDFEKYPPTELELKIWKSLRGTKSPAKATLEDKILFLIEYGKRVGTNNDKTAIKLNEFRRIYL